MDKNIPLSAAIRMGAMWNHDKTETCALGAGYLAIRGEIPGPFNPIEEIAKFEQELNLPPGLKEQIARWNDADKLTGEQIADRLERRGL